MNLEIYLVRHGRTVFNTIGRLQGWSDSPLTQEGIAVAENLGKGLKRRGIKFDAAFSSPTTRAVETARLVLDQSGQNSLPIATIADLREYSFGGWEGELTNVVQSRIAAARGLRSIDEWLDLYRHGDHNLMAESVSSMDEMKLAETEVQFVGRLQRGMAQVVEQSPENSRVLVVSHGMSITAILKSIDPNCTLYQSVPNASVSRLICKNGKWVINAVGDTSFN